MRAKKLAPVMRGLSAITASVMALSIVGADIADGYRARIDDFLGTRVTLLIRMRIRHDLSVTMRPSRK